MIKKIKYIYEFFKIIFHKELMILWIIWLNLMIIIMIYLLYCHWEVINKLIELIYNFFQEDAFFEKKPYFIKITIDLNLPHKKKIIFWINIFFLCVISFYFFFKKFRR